MFYSQFILAKKGPLGTIWIAAHLERKLRKNQVADTDIGVSVDSIICPEVPIALRLSSHLLLGVVRIYSKKVNYLFHDCSEALLKIKQAFRSTAVDLPPEESTAPYHSITLPETFDLDDFELPDAVLQGNFVDHHVSTREQITLQDKVENIIYSATQFGLDERFGDGDTSQIGLDLDEGLFLKKDVLTSNASGSTENVENQLSAQPETPFTPFVNMDVDGYQTDHDENKTVEESRKDVVNYDHSVGQPDMLQEHMVVSGTNLQRYNIRTPDLNEVIFPCENTGALDVVQNHKNPATEGPQKDLLGLSQATSTPGLLEEAVPVLQDGTLSHQGKSSPSNDTGDALPEKMQIEMECHDLGNKVADPSLVSQCVGVPLRGVVEQLMEESAEKISGHLDVPNPRLAVEADNFKGSSQELHQDSQNALLTSVLALDGGKLASIGTSEDSHSLPVDNPELLNSTQSKPAVAMDYSYSGQMITPEFVCQLKPCAMKEHINSAFSEDQVMGNSNHQLMESVAGHKMPRDGHPSLQEGQDARSAIFMTSDSLTIQTAGNVISINDSSASSRCPEPERVMVALTGDHGARSETEQFNGGQKMFEPVGTPRTCSSQSVVEHYIEPQRASVASTSSHGFSNEAGPYIAGPRVPEPEKAMVASTSFHGFQNDRDQYIAGQRVPEPVGTYRTCNNLTDMEHYMEPERAMAASTSSHSSLNEAKQYIAGQRVSEPVDNSYTFSSQSVMERYTEPDRATAASTSTHSFPTETEKYIAGQRNSQSNVEHYTEHERVMVASISTQGPEKGQYTAGQRMLQPDGFSRTSNIQPVMEHYLEPERVIVASLSSRDFPNETQKCSAGQNLLESVGISRTCNNQSVMEHYTEPGRFMVSSTNAHVFPNETQKNIEGQRRLEPFGTSLTCNSQPVMEHHPEPQSITMASTSTHLFPNETGQHIAGNKMFEPTGSAHLYSSVPIVGHYPEPERVMLASSSAHIFPNISEQSSAGKRTMELDRSAHINHNLSGKVLSFGEGTPDLLIGSSAKLPGLSRSKRKAAYIPEDDDLLASILVGKKRTSSLKVNDCPAFQLARSPKRPRLTPKPGVPKRKVLIDDTMVLHADIIRQQLMNTDDLRRMRKKAPCTRLETWMIQKFILEDEIFNESVLTGMSPVLASFQCQIYTHNRTVHPISDSRHSPLKTSKTGLPVESELLPRGVTGLDNLTVAGLRKDDAGVSVDSTTRLVMEVQQESVYATPVHDAVGHIIGLQDTVHLNSSSNAVTCSIVSTDTHDSNYRNGELVKNVGAICADSCSINDTPLNALKMGTLVETDLPPRGVTGLDNLTVAGLKKDDAGVSVDSTSHLATAVRQESVYMAPVHNAVDHIIDSQDTARLNSSSNAITCSVVSMDTRSSNYGNGELVKNMGASCADSCSINYTPLVDKDKDSEASHVTASNGLLLKVAHESLEGTVLPNKKDYTSVYDENKWCDEDGSLVLESNASSGEDSPRVLENNAHSVEAGPHVLERNTCIVEAGPHVLESNTCSAGGGPHVLESNACSTEHGRHVLESRSVVDDADNNVETSIYIVNDERHLGPREVPFGENHLQNGMDQIDLAETDGDYQASENRSVIMDEMQPTSVENEMDVDIRQQQMAISGDDKEISLAEDGKAMSLSLDEKPMLQCEKLQLPTSSDVTSTLVGSYGAQESNLETNMHLENAEGAGATRDLNDLTSTVDENDHDTEFLNIDDEVDFDEEVDYDVPNPSEDQSQSLENNGWSTRTRGVARYLKLLFDDETGYGRKSIQLDRLLSGKTRKEASRMFFETLVLKTKDYIHVEQEDGHGSISIEPRSKLLKSTF